MLGITELVLGRTELVLGRTELVLGRTELMLSTTDLMLGKAYLEAEMRFDLSFTSCLADLTLRKVRLLVGSRSLTTDLALSASWDTIPPYCTRKHCLLYRSKKAVLWYAERPSSFN